MTAPHETALVRFAPHDLTREQPDPLTDFTERWLHNRDFLPRTQLAYRRDITDYLAWCRMVNLAPLSARFTHINDYRRVLQGRTDPRTGKAAAPSSVARRLCAVSSWYDFLARLGAVPANPAAAADRPKVDKDDTTTVGMTASELTALRRAASSDRRFTAAAGVALAGFLAEIGARVSEVCNMNVEDLGHDSGHRTVRLHMKGGKHRTRAVPPGLAAALETYLGGRTTGPVFLNRDGRRINRDEVAGFVKRCAKAGGVKAWEKITPHSFRHAWVTIARERGASLEERQYALGHADPRTTQRYDRARASLDRDPSYLVAAATSG